MLKTKTYNSMYRFSVSREQWFSWLLLVSSLLFFLRIDTVVAQELQAPAWLNEEATHLEASAKPSSEGVSAYTQTFIISAYYSPLPGQQKYVTGSYEGDIRLNGSGVNGADGTPVYPGMIAAPKTYAFGTKMKIPGIGTVAVHDRGGAIVASGLRGNQHDRLDVWMGYGDQGLQRALRWGKRTVDVTVYGVDPSIVESVELDGYSDAERYPVPDSLNAPSPSSVSTQPSPPPAAPVVRAQLFPRELNYGHKGEDVAKLQKLLKDLNYYNGEVTSVFDQATYEAVKAFQVSERIVHHGSAYGVGYVGPKTMSVLAQKVPAAVAQAKAEQLEPVNIFMTTLKLGDSGEEVRKLQEELQRVNLLGIEPTGYYGEVTEHAVFKFQQIHRLVGDKNSEGAGIFGPVTRAKFTSVVAARLETDRQKQERSVQ